MLLFSAFLLRIITLFKKQQRDPQVPKWLILSLGFLYISMDELGCFHELLILPLQRLFGNLAHGIFFFAWVIPGIFIVILLALYFLKFLLSLPANTKYPFIFAGFLYVGGALGFELIGGNYLSLHAARDLTYSFITTVEESMEMIGIIIFIHTLLKYIEENCREVILRFSEES